MRRSSVRELALLCAPVVLLGGGLVLSRVLHPPRDPNARIVLTVASDPLYAETPVGNSVGFGWQAQAKGGPKEGLQMGFSERVVASGHGNSLVIYSDPLLPAKKFSWGVGTGTNGGKGARFNRHMELQWDELPVWVQKLEWQGEVVAKPRDSGNTTAPTLPKTLRSWALRQGATRVWKRFPIALSARKLNPIQKCSLEAVNPQNAALGADACITVEWKDAKRRVFRRLEAFDGVTRRVLWSDEVKGRNPYWKSEQLRGSLPGVITHNSLLFRLRDVPASWGRITFSLDAVFDPRLNAGQGATPCDAATIQKLKSRGWIPFSRQLTVRAK